MKLNVLGNLSKPSFLCCLAILMTGPSLVLFRQAKASEMLQAQISRSDLKELRIIAEEVDALVKAGTEVGGVTLRISQNLNVGDVPLSEAIEDGVLILKAKNREKSRIVISGSGPKVVILAQRGTVEVQGWQDPLKVSLTSGQIRTSNVQSPAELHAISGAISVNEHRGNLVINSFDGKVDVENAVGSIAVENFQGTTQLKALEGEVQIRAQKGEVQLNTSKGRTLYRLGSGKLNIVNTTGAISGDSKDGEVKIRVLPETTVNVKSEGGKVNLLLSPGQSVSADLRSLTGKIQAPSALKLGSSGKYKTVSGRLAGTESRIALKARTDSGSIVLSVDR